MLDVLFYDKVNVSYSYMYLRHLGEEVGMCVFP